MSIGKSRKRRTLILEDWEVALIKAMFKTIKNDQDILPYFSRPTRSINHRVIAEIRTNRRSPNIPPATVKELKTFLDLWPDCDPNTGLSIRGDELLIKAREAMISAVHIFNSAGITFRTELFIVTAIIAWTYLLHAWFKKEGINYKYDDTKAKYGRDRYWDLSQCLASKHCPLGDAPSNNLKFLIGLRDEVVHESTNLDETIGAHLQSCCINFNEALKKNFGERQSLEKRLSIALQFVSFGADQKEILKKAATLPPNIASFIGDFEGKLTEAELEDHAYRISIALIPIAKNRPTGADRAVYQVSTGSEAADEITQIIFKDRAKQRYIASQIVDIAKKRGFEKFNLHKHTALWKDRDGKNASKGYGCPGDYKDSWVWFDSWLAIVLKHCEDGSDLYK